MQPINKKVFKTDNEIAEECLKYKYSGMRYETLQQLINSVLEKGIDPNSNYEYLQNGKWKDSGETVYSIMEM